MKKIIMLLSAILFLSSAISAQSDRIAQGARYVKLANSYIHNRDFGKAFEILRKAENELKNIDSRDALYWKAAVSEAYGISFSNMNMKDEAKKYLEEALAIYSKIIKMPGGSPDAIEIIMSNLEVALLEVQSKDYQKGNPVAGMTNLANFDNSKLRQLPNNLPSDMENISLAENKFREFPSELMKFSNLKYVNLSKNNISGVNVGFGSLKKLKWLDLSDNKIKELGDGISEATSLEYLNLSDNRLKEVPIGLIKLKSLKILNLKGNRIPFAKIKTLIQSMPSTNILHDEYVPIEVIDEEF